MQSSFPLSKDKLNSAVFREQIERNGDTLHDNILVYADNIRLKQVILNLLSNAIKYNHAGGEAWLSCLITDSDSVRVSIKDNGIGIADELQSSIFEPFNRLGAENSDIEGTGIGLIITKRLIELMDSQLEFHSKRNTGSSFSFSLKIATEHPDHRR